jgi:hypothetical protein
LHFLQQKKTCKLSCAVNLFKHQNKDGCQCIATG